MIGNELAGRSSEEARQLWGLPWSGCGEEGFDGAVEEHRARVGGHCPEAAIEGGSPGQRGPVDYRRRSCGGYRCCHDNGCRLSLVARRGRQYNLLRPRKERGQVL